MKTTPACARLLGAALIASLTFAPAPSAHAESPATARGVVYHDRNADQTRQADEPGLKDVLVSNGLEIVSTDADGKYELPVDDDTIIFVIKPSGWASPLNEQNLPRFYYIHKPNGSPQSRFPGVAPTGPLPASIDFPLTPNTEPDKFKSLWFGDTQPRDKREVEFLAHDIFEGLIGVDRSEYLFGATLGDIVFDNLSVFDDLNDAIAKIGVPWHNIIGNHDINKDSPDDKYSDETFERIYGPNYYAFNYGPIHFIALDDIHWDGKDYEGSLGERQLEFVRNDLARVAKDRLVVLGMHIPLTNVGDRAKLFELLKDFPHTMSISAHTHNQRHVFMGKDHGWLRDEPHHHLINATTCGSWMSGTLDEYGIPHALMSDGAPNGYSIITFERNGYTIEYRAARREAEHQMNIYVPDRLPIEGSAGHEILVNVFAGSEKSTVRMKLEGADQWIEMKLSPRPDPGLLRLKEIEPKLPANLGRKLPDPNQSPHIWAGPLPQVTRKGANVLTVETTDMFGQLHRARRIFFAE